MQCTHTQTHTQQILRWTCHHVAQLFEQRGEHGNEWISERDNGSERQRVHNDKSASTKHCWSTTTCIQSTTERQIMAKCIQRRASNNSRRRCWWWRRRRQQWQQPENRLFTVDKSKLILVRGEAPSSPNEWQCNKVLWRDRERERERPRKANTICVQC